jgi:4-alpha-glucanotransferase
MARLPALDPAAAAAAGSADPHPRLIEYCVDHRPWLRALAESVGVSLSFHDVSGREHRLDEPGAVALLRAMGFDADTEAAAEAGLRRMEDARREEVVPPVVVVPVHEGEPPLLRFRITDALQPPCRWEVDVEHEGGERTALGDATHTRDVAAVLAGVGHGYHRVTVTIRAGAAVRTAATMLIVTPPRCWTTADVLGDSRAYGLWTNLYSVRSRENWGVGDLADLRRLVAFAGGEGAAFVGVNPLHALRNRGSDISPYSPVSRLFRNPLYISVPDVPELGESASARALIASAPVQRELASLREAALVDYDAVRTLKERVLRLLFAEFIARHRGAGTDRGSAFDDYAAREGRPLEDFATFLALEAHLSVDGHPRYWRDWPEAYRDPFSTETRQFRAEHADDVDFHRWIQFELDRQLGLAAREAREVGMPIGLYQDLAVGSSDGGSDVWASQHLFDRGVTVGAPPDEYASDGQDWGLPPLDPNRLRGAAYGYWIGLVRAGFRHAGALRIDHAMGLARLYWIPPGLGAVDGAYVRYPADDLLGIIALESHRHRAIVIAEDLGTVPEGFEELLARWGILSSRVLWFEREDGGGFKRPDEYIERALVTTTTHDHAPLAAWLTAEDAEVRRGIGVLSDEEADGARQWRAHERGALLERLRQSGTLDGDDAEPPYAAMLAAVYAFIAATPARLVGVSLDDLAEETQPVNIPGVGPDRYPAWSRRMRMSLGALTTDAAAARALQGVRDRLQER